MEAWKILLVDDHQLIREGIMAYLDAEPDLQVVATAANGHEALEKLKEQEIQIVIMDISMPGMGGQEATQQIADLYPDILVIVLSMFDDATHIKQLMKAGARGYLLKNSDQTEVISAIRKVLAGEIYYSPAAARSVMDSLSRQGSKLSALKNVRFTPREKEILKLILADQSNQEMAEQLFISTRTVEAHKRNLMVKTQSNTIAGLVRFVYENDLIDD
ncbi:MAG: response regulator transcription factor [Bacteroidota bacterium]